MGLRFRIGGMCWSSKPPRINPSDLENRISQQDFDQFWARFWAVTGKHVCIRIFLMLVTMAAFIALVVNVLNRNYLGHSYLSLGIAIFIVILVIFQVMNYASFKNNLIALIAHENQDHFWQQRGLRWSLRGWGRYMTIHLDVIVSAGPVYTVPVTHVPQIHQAQIEIGQQLMEPQNVYSPIAENQQILVVYNEGLQPAQGDFQNMFAHTTIHQQMQLGPNFQPIRGNPVEGYQPSQGYYPNQQPLDEENLFKPVQNNQI